MSLPLHKYGISRSAIIETEIDRAGLAELVEKSRVEKACYKRLESLGIAPYPMRDLKHLPMTSWKLKEESLKSR